MTRPTWEEIYAMKPLKTAEEAAAIRGGTCASTAHKWAASRGVKWARKWVGTPWSLLFAEGLTLSEAVAKSGGERRQARDWAYKNGVKWPTRSRDDSETVKRDPKKPRKYAWTCRKDAIERYEQRMGL